MLKNYLLITLRNMMKNKLFIFINVLGMGLAVALCIIAYLNWNFREDWDKDQHLAEKIYLVQCWHDVAGKAHRYGGAPLPLGDHIRQNINDVNKVVRFISSESNFRIGDELFRTSLAYADSLFFEMFSFEVMHGLTADFKSKSTVLISDELARKYFNREDVVGEQITRISQGTLTEFTVAAVFKKPPLNSSFYFDAVTLWDNNEGIGAKADDWKEWNTIFLQIEDPANVPSVAKQLRQYIEPQHKAREDFKIREYYLENFKGFAARSIERPRLRGSALRYAMPKAVVDIPSIMAVLLLLLACFNFTNTSIALSSQRIKEIGIRKVMGGVRKQLILQFLGENLLLCFLGLVTGLILAELLVPAYDHLWVWLELDLKYADNAGFLLFLVGLLLLTALLAGAYPAFYITSFEPIGILKGKTKFGGTNWLTRVLLGVQFSISILTIIFAIGFYHNAEYQKNYDLGYYNTGVISVFVENEGAFNAYRDALSGNPNILQIAGTKNHLVNSYYQSAVKYGSLEREIEMMEVGDHYLEAMNMRIVVGREFRKDSETDRRESVLVSEEFVKQFGWKDDPLGKRLVWKDTIQFYVIGVVKDIYAHALFRPVEPMLLRYTAPSEYTQLVARVSPDKMAAANEFMEKKWKAVFPTTNYNGQFIDNKMRETIDTNNNVIVIFGFIGFFAGLMSATGLFTLVSLHILKRTKEIGVRKVLGASFGNIMGVISFEFLLIILFASLLGGIVGYVMVDVSMNAAWEYYEKVSPTTFITAVTIILFVAFITVGYKIIATARMNPVKTLRDE
jgi:putative ABC transport system permease protein